MPNFTAENCPALTDVFFSKKRKIRVTQVLKEHKKALSLFWGNRNTYSAVKFFRGKTVFLHPITI